MSYQPKSRVIVFFIATALFIVSSRSTSASNTKAAPRRIDRVLASHKSMHPHLEKLLHLYDAMFQVKEMEINPLKPLEIFEPVDPNAILPEHLSRIGTMHALPQAKQTVADHLTHLGTRWKANKTRHDQLPRDKHDIREPTVLIDGIPINDAADAQTRATLQREMRTLVGQIGDLKAKLRAKIAESGTIASGLPNPIAPHEHPAFAEQFSAIADQIIALQVRYIDITEQRDTLSESPRSQDPQKLRAIVIDAHDRLQTTVDSIIESTAYSIGRRESLRLEKAAFDSNVQAYFAKDEPTVEDSQKLNQQIESYATIIDNLIKDETKTLEKERAEIEGETTKIVKKLLPERIKTVRNNIAKGTMMQPSASEQEWIKRYREISAHLSTEPALDWTVHSILDALQNNDLPDATKQELGLVMKTKTTRTIFGKDSEPVRNLDVFGQHLYHHVKLDSKVLFTDHEAILTGIAGIFAQTEINDDRITAFDRIFDQVALHLGIVRDADSPSTDLATALIDHAEHTRDNEEVLRSLATLSAHFTEAAGIHVFPLSWAVQSIPIDPNASNIDDAIDQILAARRQQQYPNESAAASTP